MKLGFQSMQNIPREAHHRQMHFPLLSILKVPCYLPHSVFRSGGDQRRTCHRWRLTAVNHISSGGFHRSRCLFASLCKSLSIICIVFCAFLIVLSNLFYLKCWLVLLVCFSVRSPQCHVGKKRLIQERSTPFVYIICRHSQLNFDVTFWDTFTVTKKYSRQQKRRAFTKLTKLTLCTT